MDKTTDELMKILNQKPDPAQYMKENSQEILQESLTEFLQRLLKEKISQGQTLFDVLTCSAIMDISFLTGAENPAETNCCDWRSAFN